MPRVRTRGVNTVRKRLADETWRDYHYHRATGTPLPGKPGSPEFVRAWLAAEEPPDREEGTLAALIRAYLASPAFRRTASNTQTEYRRMLTRIDERFGKMPLNALESPKAAGAFVEWRAEIGERHSREADSRIQTLLSLLGYAKRTGRIAALPSIDFKRLHRKNRAKVILKR